jgi:excisionase family DNA binding protein
MNDLRSRKPIPVDRLLTVAEVAAFLRVSKMTVYRLCESDELASIRVGRSIRIDKDSFGRYVRQGGNDPDEYVRP